jgi:hypothetical protein
METAINWLIDITYQAELTLDILFHTKNVSKCQGLNSQTLEIN